ncbi:hypothetical protein QWY93_17470 [Echinicola jeungdonensis]|uniref:Uncharacterized protein n=1 Tax=Echinicola jeungdonensis TaxID=709343 RepID=A0ABV5J0F0_9BACT|nr:hypothetical protein [Echinicola jeungdonensis]MDN3671105.1 hypothetical protein [Echinicola jeungdonensis]
MDSSRLVNEASGCSNRGAGDVADVHNYPPRAYPSSPYQAFACGEYGGIGYQLDGHIWNPEDLMQYVTINNEKEYLGMYSKFTDMLTEFKTNQGLSAAVYTEITDVEIELNGIMTYDRVMKVVAEQIAKANHQVIHEIWYSYDIVPFAKNADKIWHYTIEKPSPGWMETDSWDSGKAGSGSPGTPGAINGTSWTSPEIWLRRDFELGNLSKINLDNLRLKIHHDDESVVYFNGIKAAELDGFTSSYVNVKISQEARKALISNGTNVIAIHCKQHSGGEYIDAGFSIATGNKALPKSTLEKVKGK